MSGLVGGHLETPTSYPFLRDKIQEYRRKSIEPSVFNQWMKSDMYKSSYAHHHSPQSVQPRHAHIPGYAGYMPNDKSESLHAKRFSQISKQVLSNPKITLNNQFGLATTGRNLNTQSLCDSSKEAASSKYGKTALLKPHPGWTPEEWKSTTKDTYKAPDSLVHPTYRAGPVSEVHPAPAVKTSGFAQNRAFFDGHGWNPHPVLTPLNVSSQYRDRFNPQRPFHLDSSKIKPAKLEPVERTYRFNK